jgi:hypothetical protein
MDGPQSQSGSRGIEKKLLPRPGIVPRPSTPQPVSIPTEFPGPNNYDDGDDDHANDGGDGDYDDDDDDDDDDNNNNNNNNKLSSLFLN